MARRLYLGKLPTDARSEDVAKLFEGYGRIVDCRVMTGSSKRRPENQELTEPAATGFGFVEFESSKDAEDAVHHFNGKPFMGVNIVVEFAREGRPRREPYDRDGAARSRRPPGIRLIVTGISRDTSWQDLKDFGREAGSVSFADIDNDYPGTGVLEYLNRDDADHAVRELDGKDLRGRPVRVAYDDHRSGPDNYRRDERDRHRDDRYSRDDRHKEDRHSRDDRNRRERSRSPHRRDFDDRRPRSPPPNRRDYDERKPAGYDDYRRGGYYDDRRDPDYYNDRRREDRREDRRRDDKDDRYDDRAARTNGDGAWR